MSESAKIGTGAGRGSGRRLIAALALLLTGAVILAGWSMLSGAVYHEPSSGDIYVRNDGENTLNLREVLLYSPSGAFLTGGADPNVVVEETAHYRRLLWPGMGISMAPQDSIYVGLWNTEMDWDATSYVRIAGDDNWSNKVDLSDFQALNANWQKAWE